MERVGFCLGPLTNTVSDGSFSSCISPYLNSCTNTNIPNKFSYAHDDKPVTLVIPGLELPKPLTKDELPKPERFKPHTAPWVVQRLKMDKLEDALTTLRVWTHGKQQMEASAEIVNHIKVLEEEDTVKAVNIQKKP